MPNHRRCCLVGLQGLPRPLLPCKEVPWLVQDLPRVGQLLWPEATCPERAIVPAQSTVARHHRHHLLKEVSCTLCTGMYPV